MNRLAPVLSLTVALSACSKEEPVVEVAGRPGLTLDEPAAAAWLQAGTTTVRGTAANLQQIEINGAPIKGVQESWQGEVELERGINIVEARGLGEDGDQVFVRNGVIAGDFGDPGQSVEDAAWLRLNRGGIDDLMALVGSLVDARTIEEAAQGVNPVYEDSYGIWGWDAVTIAADVAGIDFATPVLSATPGDGELALDVALPDLVVTIEAYGEVVGIDFDTTVTLQAERAVVEGTLTAQAAHGALKVELADASVSLEGFSYDTSLLPGDVEDYILVDTIRGKIEETLLEQIQTMVPALLDETLAGLDPSFETELLGVQVSVAASFASVFVDSAGIAMTVDLDVDVPSSGDLTYAGFLVADQGEPTLDRTSDLAAAVSDDLLNRILFEAWRGGLMELELSTEDGSLDSFMLASLKAEEGTIKVRADLPPVIVERNHGLQAQVGELQVEVLTPGGELGERLALSVGAFAGLDLVYDDGELGVDVGEVETSLMVRSSDWGASNEATTQLIEEMLPLDTFLGLLSALSFPIPEIYGLRIAEGEAKRDASGVFTGVTVELELAR